MGYKEVISFLIEKGANPYAQNNKGETPLHYSAKIGDFQSMKLLIEKGSDVNAITKKAKATPLHFAAFKGHLQAITLLLIHGAEINAKDEHGQTPLIFAIYAKHTQIVKFLINSGADINAKNNYNTSPLHVSISQENTEVVKLLIQNGADTNAKDIINKTVLHYLIYKGDLGLIKFLLTNDADINSKDIEGLTPLHYAAILGDTQTIKFLITNKAEVNAKTEDGHTPLHKAALYNKVSAIILLLQSGADINAKDLNHKRAIDLAKTAEAKNIFLEKLLELAYQAENISQVIQMNLFNSLNALYQKIQELHLQIEKLECETSSSILCCTPQQLTPRPINQPTTSGQQPTHNLDKCLIQFSNTNQRSTDNEGTRRSDNKKRPAKSSYTDRETKRRQREGNQPLGTRYSQL